MGPLAGNLLIGNQRFQSNRRLLDSNEFDSVFKNNQYRVGCPEFLVLATANEHSTSRIGMVIGKKTTALAVNRNTIKRLIRESFRRCFSEEPHMDLVIISRKAVNKRSNRELADTLQGLWRKLDNKIRVETAFGAGND